MSRDPGASRVIAIDGPSGTGKSSVARELARRVGAAYLDTGAMYRALTVAVLADGLDPADADAVAARARSLTIAVVTDPEIESVVADGRDVTEAIRSAEVTAAVSAVSAVPAVRRVLVEAQRSLAADARVVVEGRDIGTVVFPAARLKIFLTASAAERAARRAAQLGITNTADMDELAETLRIRDEYDSSRPDSPLRPAADAVVVDSTQLSEEDVLETILSELKSRDRSE